MMQQQPTQRERERQRIQQGWVVTWRDLTHPLRPRSHNALHPADRKRGPSVRQGT